LVTSPMSSDARVLQEAKPSERVDTNRTNETRPTAGSFIKIDEWLRLVVRGFE
jgi:hypothetical protein